LNYRQAWFRSGFAAWAEPALVAGGMLVLALLPTAPHLIPCPFALVSHAGCPTCGTTRSLWFIMHGHFSEAWQMNPLGYVCAGIFLLRLACFASARLRFRVQKCRLEPALLAVFLVAGLVHWITVVIVTG